ncbi:hypothetical protein [Caldiplasma sukawensis]
MNSDIVKKTRYINEKNVTVDLSYRLNFDGTRSCGQISVFMGKTRNDENFEIYSELLECGLNRNDLDKRFQKVVDEIIEGKIDVEL